MVFHLFSHLKTLVFIIKAVSAVLGEGTAPNDQLFVMDGSHQVGLKHALLMAQWLAYHKFNAYFGGWGIVRSCTPQPLINLVLTVPTAILHHSDSSTAG